MTNYKYGKFTVLKIDEERTCSNKSKEVYWVCQCECGKLKTIIGTNIRSNKARKNCGCEKMSKKMIALLKAEEELKQEKQQLTRCETIWRAMMQRCYNPNCTDYHNYGAKGKKACRRWHNKDNFIEDMFPLYLEYEKEHGLNTATIDRIDGEWGYSKNNCRWLTRGLQQRNKTGYTHKSTVKGKKYDSIGQLIEDYPEFNWRTLIYRYNRGWRDDELILPLETKIKEYREERKRIS